MTLVLNGTTGVSAVDGSAATPAIQGNDTNTGVFFPAADTVAIATNGTERVRVDSSGNVGIGTSSPASNSITFARGASTNASLELAGNNNTAGTTSLSLIQAGDNTAYLYNRANGVMIFGTNNIERGRFDVSGNFLFNSGYGSVATAYGCRAWVNFNGTGTVAIRASGNVSSITDNGVGDYTVNFTNAMPDTNYALVNGAQPSTDTFSVANIFYSGAPYSPTTTSVRLRVGNHAAKNDDTIVNIAIFR